MRPEGEGAFRATPFAGWAIGAVAAGIVHFMAPAWCEAVVGMLAGGLSYYVIELARGTVSQTERAAEPLGAE